MGPKQKGGGSKQRGNAAEEVEDTLQAVVCLLSCNLLVLLATVGRDMTMEFTMFGCLTL
jgi:hypothetical protein